MIEKPEGSQTVLYKITTIEVVPLCSSIRMSTSLLEYSAAALILSISTVLFLLVYVRDTQPLLSKLPYPPGPAPAGAISGNRNQIKSTPRVWRKYKEWAEQLSLIHI